MNLRNKINKIFVLFIILTLSIISLEVMLRFFGYTPWKYIDDRTGINKSDDTKGWIAKEGSHEIIASKEYMEKTIMNILKEGNRFTGLHSKKKEKIIIIGGSFTQGWGVNDNETYSFNLQTKLKNYEIANFGQSGYGTVQSYLLLKEIFNKYDNIKLVLYGFIDHHEYRNVARAEWLETLLKFSGKNNKLKPKIPYANLDLENKIIIKDPISYIKLPLREFSALVTVIEKIYMKKITKSRKKIQKDLVDKLSLEIKNITEAKKAKFIFVNLKSNIEEHKIFFLKNKINFVDCNLSLNNDLLIKGDYHPNGKAHSFYSECILEYINKNKLLF